MKMNMFANRQRLAARSNDLREGHGIADGVNTMPAVIPTMTSGALMFGGAVVAAGATIGIATLISNKGNVEKTYDDIKEMASPGLVSKQVKQGVEEAMAQATVKVIAIDPKTQNQTPGQALDKALHLGDGEETTTTDKEKGKHKSGKKEAATA